jgi:hypothetical protein
MSDTTEIKAFLHCRTCGAGMLAVGVSTENELVVACERCQQIVLAVKKWPMPELMNMKCEACEHEGKHKRNVN